MFGRRNAPSNPENSSPSPAGNGNGNPPHIVRLIEAMQTMFQDASTLAASLKRGEHPTTARFYQPETGPIRCDLSGRLFEHEDENGKPVFSMFHFSRNMNNLDPNAQVQLSRLMGFALIANTVLQAENDATARTRDTDLANMIDTVIALSAFFAHYFEGFAFSTDLLMGRVDRSRLQDLIQEHVRSFNDRMRDAQYRMVNGSRLLSVLPDKAPSFVVETSAPSRDGEKFINGVYFPPDYASAMIEDAAAKQADAIADLQNEH